MIPMPFFEHVKLHIRISAMRKHLISILLKMSIILIDYVFAKTKLFRTFNQFIYLEQFDGISNGQLRSWDDFFFTFL